MDGLDPQAIALLTKGGPWAVIVFLVVRELFLRNGGVFSKMSEVHKGLTGEGEQGKPSRLIMIEQLHAAAFETNADGSRRPRNLALVERILQAIQTQTAQQTEILRELKTSNAAIQEEARAARREVGAARREIAAMEKSLRGAQPAGAAGPLPKKIR